MTGVGVRWQKLTPRTPLGLVRLARRFATVFPPKEHATRRPLVCEMVSKLRTRQRHQARLELTVDLLVAFLHKLGSHFTQDVINDSAIDNCQILHDLGECSKKLALQGVAELVGLHVRCKPYVYMLKLENLYLQNPCQDTEYRLPQEAVSRCGRAKASISHKNLAELLRIVAPSLPSEIARVSRNSCSPLRVLEPFVAIRNNCIRRTAAVERLLASPGRLPLFVAC